MATERPTVELPPTELPRPPTAEPHHPDTTYSVSKKRATTEDDRREMIERVPSTGRIPIRRMGSVSDATAAASEPEKWRVELSANRIWIKSPTHAIELPVDDARAVAELILRATAR